MALIYSEGFDFVNDTSWSWEGMTRFNSFIAVNADGTGNDINRGWFNGNGRWAGQCLRCNSLQYVSGISGFGAGGAASFSGNWLLTPPFVVSHPTEIRLAFYAKIPGVPADQWASGGFTAARFWSVRLTNSNQSNSIAIYFDSNTFTNGVWVSRYEANVANLRPIYNGGKWTNNNLWDGQYHHYELRFVAANGSNASGAVQMWIDGSQYINITSNVTSNSVGQDLTLLNRLEFGAAPGILTDYDDLLVWDNSANTMNSRVGLHRIRNLRPRANGNYSQFGGFANSGGNWFSLSELNNNGQTDSDTSYVEDSTVGDKDSYRLSWANGNIGTVQAVVVKPIVKNPDTGTKTFSIFVRSGGAESNLGRIITANSTYSRNAFIFNTDPSTNTAWTAATANNFEIGIQVES